MKQLTHCLEMPKGQLLRVLVEQDNASVHSVVSYIRKQGGSKRSIALLVEMTLKWAFQHNIMLLAGRWIPGLEMAADEWSRAKALEDRGDWCIRQEAFEWVCKTLDVRPEMDLFASRLHNKCDRYYSFRRDPCALDFDALSADKNWAQAPGGGLLRGASGALAGQGPRKDIERQSLSTAGVPCALSGKECTGGRHWSR
jgi:hypothetical protein